MQKILEQLGIKTQAINAGACLGDGVWLAGDKTNLLCSINPSNEETLAQVAKANEADYQQVIQAAVEASQRWKQVPAPERGLLVAEMGRLLRQHKDALGSLVTLEMGKSKAEGDGEVQEMIDMADFAVGQSRMMYGKTMHSERVQHRMYEQWHPLGVVGVITAFNFPVAVWAWNAFVAAICGNTVVWKPSHKTPLTAIAVQHLCNQAMQRCDQPGVFASFIGDHSLAERFVADKRIDLLSFTGSTQAGSAVRVKVAARMGKSLLELGGNNAIIVTEHANLDLAIPAIVFGAVGTAGQRCTSTRRVLVQRSVFEEVKQALVAAYQQVTIGDPLDSSHHMGPLIDQAAVDNYSAAIEAINRAGGEIIMGGKPLPGPGFYVEPTLALAENHWEIVQRETFAPILYLIPYDTLNQAMAMHNDVPQGLSSAIFTENLIEAETFLSSVGSDCGIANVNIGTSGAEIGGAFGGEKQTGGGREAGSDAWQAYMRRQTNTINWGRGLPLAQGINFSLK